MVLNHAGPQWMCGQIFIDLSMVSDVLPASFGYEYQAAMAIQMKIYRYTLHRRLSHIHLLFFLIDPLRQGFL